MHPMKVLICLLTAVSVIFVGMAPAADAEGAEKLNQVDTQEITESGMGKETAWMICETDLKNVWKEIDRHINPLKADRTLPYYSYHIIEGRYYIVVAYVDKEWKLHEQWMDVTAYCEIQIPKLQEIGIHVKKINDILDSITSREEADIKASELKEVFLQYAAATFKPSDMPPYVFPQLIEYYHANQVALYERIIDFVRKGSYGSEKLDQLLRGLIP